MLIYCVGQLLGIALSLSISGAAFVNTAINGLQKILPNVPRQKLQAAISGTSGGFFETLDPATKAMTLDVIMGSLQKTWGDLDIFLFRKYKWANWIRFTLVYVAGAVGLVASLFLSVSHLLIHQWHMVC